MDEREILPSANVDIRSLKRARTSSVVEDSEACGRRGVQDTAEASVHVDLHKSTWLWSHEEKHDISTASMASNNGFSMLSRQALGAYIRHDTGGWAFQHDFTKAHPVFGISLGPVPSIAMWHPKKQLQMFNEDIQRIRKVQEASLRHRVSVTCIAGTPEKVDAQGSFRFFDLPPELRNHIYELVALDAGPDGCWKPLPFLRSNQLMRKESLGIYASSCTFKVKVGRLDQFFKMVPQDFARHLKNFMVLLPISCERKVGWDMYSVFWLKCCAAPECNISFLPTRDISYSLLPVPVEGGSSSLNPFNGILNKVNKTAIAETLNSRMIESIFFNAKGEMTQVTARPGLWMSYQDLKTAFGMEKYFTLTVNAIPWTSTQLVKPIGTKTSRAIKKTLEGGSASTTPWEEHVQQSSSDTKWPRIAQPKSWTTGQNSSSQAAGFSLASLHKSGKILPRLPSHQHSFEEPKQTLHDTNFNFFSETQLQKLIWPPPNVRKRQWFDTFPSRSQNQATLSPCLENIPDHIWLEIYRRREESRRDIAKMVDQERRLQNGGTREDNSDNEEEDINDIGDVRLMKRRRHV